MSRFDGRTVIVTGASRGIGLGIARRVVEEGGKAVITARKEDELVAAVAELGEGNAVYSVGRADDAEHQEATVQLAIDTFGSADLLVNNAGINPHAGDVVDIGIDAARKTLEVNTLAPLFWVRAAHRLWMKEHGGVVVNVTSVAGLRPPPMIGWYGVTKRALVALTEQLALELGPSIRVNAVAPAVVKTKFSTVLYEGREEAVSEAYPLKRLGVPDDIAGVVAFLLSDDAAWMTGQTLTVDGGVLLGGGIA
jgi:3-oxoacyl-[acyl-carrier protein] reductase